AVKKGLWHGHNIFLSLAVGLGVQGLAAFVFLLYRIFKSLRPERGGGRSWLGAGPAAPIRYATFVMVLGFLVANQTTDLFEDDTALLFFLLLGCAFSMRAVLRPFILKPTDDSCADSSQSL
ncbi:MAG: hypothetical protein AB1896_23600, partial [Thermodesulfobacteriota bacterium]